MRYLAPSLALALAACTADQSADEALNNANDTATPANAMAAGPVDDNGPPPPPDDGDATVAGTDYNATTILDCGFDGAAPTQSCDAGIKRNWGEDGSHLVEVTKPDGFKRAIFFEGTTPVGADSAQADGSAGWDFSTSREGDRVTVSYGPETYVIVDAMIEGG